MVRPWECGPEFSQFVEKRPQTPVETSDGPNSSGRRPPPQIYKAGVFGVQYCHDDLADQELIGSVGD
jgi:hypothetical protein